MNLSCALVFLFVINIASSYTTFRGWMPWDEDEDETRNIVGGTPITDGQFPYLVSIRFNGIHGCGGSILNERYILTAAHCVEDKNYMPDSIQYGKVKINPRGPNVVPIKNYTIHEKYVIKNYPTPHDIAVIELQEDIKFGKYVSPVRLPHQNEVVPETNKMFIMGWGSTKYRVGPASDHGLYTIISKYPDAKCQDKYIEYRYCAGVNDFEGGRGGCNGDSGGPVMINGKQYGVVSGNVGDLTCADPGSYDLHTRVPTYRLWIYKHTGV